MYVIVPVLRLITFNDPDTAPVVASGVPIVGVPATSVLRAGLTAVTGLRALRRVALAGARSVVVV